jgi:hypothetical protein
VVPNVRHVTAALASDGGEPPAVRRSWLPRTVAAIFLGAGVYASLALVGEVAHADDTTVTATQAPAEPTTPGDAAASGAASPTPAPATQNSTTQGSTTSPTTADTTNTGSTAPDPATTPPAAPAAGSTGSDPAGAATPGTTSTTATTTNADGSKTTVPTTVTPKSGTATTAENSTAEPTAVGAATPVSPTAVSTPSAPAMTPAVVRAADEPACHTAPVPGVRAGGSASRNQPATSYAPVGLTTHAPRPAAEATTVPAAAVTLSGPASDGAPAQPQNPSPLPAPEAAFALSGCGGPGAGEGSPKGTSAPTAAAGVLGSVIDIPVAETDAAPQAPAAGSPTLSANDPATRPD